MDPLDSTVVWPSACMLGDATLFRRADTAQVSWCAQRLLDAWTRAPPKDFPNYAAGGNGPKAADEPLARDRSSRSIGTWPLRPFADHCQVAR